MRKLKKWVMAVLLAGFILGNCKGYLALWDADREDPIQIFPCPVKTLPEADQKALEEGIRARSRMELEGLLEDFLS